MNLTMDVDVQEVAVYMQENIATDKLIGVANSLGSIAELLWGHYPKVSIVPIVLSHPQITSLPQSTASE
jgi:hypothetical protein